MYFVFCVPDVSLRFGSLEWGGEATDRSQECFVDQLIDPLGSQRLGFWSAIAVGTIRLANRVVEFFQLLEFSSLCPLF